MRAAGASLTAKLALGGTNWTDSDPAVLEAAPPFVALVAMLWDQPRLRPDFIAAWHAARVRMVGCTKKQRWRCVNGPVSAALAHLQDIEADWKSPFLIHILGHDICTTTTPPKQIQKLLQEHARLHLDGRLIGKIAAMTGDDVDDVLNTYSNGIDWEMVRATLRNADKDLEQLEVRALELVVTLAFWGEERRWHAGMLGEGSCRACFAATGCNKHRLHTCDGVVQYCSWQVALGRIRRQPDIIHDNKLAPLIWHGLPPRTTRWQPVVGRARQEAAGTWTTGTYFGDGSATEQHDRDRRRATAALWQPPSSTAQEDIPGKYMRRAVTGWFPTSARGELLAAIDFLDTAPSTSTFIGDCSYVLDTLKSNIPLKARSSASIDADLWRIAKRALDAKGGRFTFIKTKAHRSRQAAEDAGPESLKEWEGNKAADELARGLCRSLQQQLDPRDDCRDRQYRDLLQRAAVGAGWSLRHWPEVGAAKRPRGARRASDERDASGTVGPHPVRPRQGGGLVCTKCKLWAATPSSIKSLRGKPCLGPVMGQCHGTHQMRWTHGVVWCCACGRYTSRIPTSLRQACPRRPLSEAGKNVLNRLRRGLPPTTAGYLKRVRNEDNDREEKEAAANSTHSVNNDAGHGATRTDSSQNYWLGIRTEPENSQATSRPQANMPEAGTSPGGHHVVEPANMIPTSADVQGGSSSSGTALTSSAILAHLSHAAPTSRITDLDLGNGLRPRPRRRLVGKQAPPGVPGTTPPAAVSARTCMQPCRTTAWSRRIGFNRLPFPSSCMVCSSDTRTTCSSCSSPLCVVCARARRPCPATE